MNTSLRRFLNRQPEYVCFYFASVVEGFNRLLRSQNIGFPLCIDMKRCTAAGHQGSTRRKQLQEIGALNGSICVAFFIVVNSDK